MSEHTELGSCDKILELRCRHGHSTDKFVANSARKHYAIFLGSQAHPDLLGSVAVVRGHRHKTVVRRFGLGFFPGILQTDVDVPAGAAAHLFNFGEIGAIIPVRFGVVVPGDGVEARGFGFATSDDGVSHADDGGGVPAAAQLSKYGAIGAKPTPDGGGADRCE